MPTALIASGLAAAGTVGSALISSSAAGKAADAQVAASGAAITEQRRQFDVSREDMAPWMEAGKEGLGLYSGILKGERDPGMDLKNYPGYQFALEEGVSAIDKSSAARGLTQSGQHLKDLTQYGQGLATSNFENYMNRLQGLSGVGQQTAVQTGTMGMNMANQIGASERQAGQARATGYQDKASVWGGAIEGLAGLGGQYVGGLGNTPYTPPPPGTGANYGYGAGSPLNY